MGLKAACMLAGIASALPLAVEGAIVSRSSMQRQQEDMSQL